MIKEWINEITQFGGENLSYLLVFHGDGHGENEEHEAVATQETVLKYLEHLEEQRKIAQKYLEEKYGKEGLSIGN